VTLGAHCKILPRRWVFLYDGAVTTTASRFDIDHDKTPCTPPRSKIIGLVVRESA